MRHRAKTDIDRSLSGYRVFVWLAAMWVMGFLADAVEMALSNDFSLGMNVINGFVMMVLLVPIAGIALLLASIPPLRSHRFILSLLAAAVAVSFPNAQLIWDRIHPEQRFERNFGTSLPPHRTNFQCDLNGGFLVNVRDWYYFEAPAAETDALISSMKLTRDTASPFRSASPLPHDSNTWDGMEVWTTDSSLRRFQTNTDHTRVFFQDVTY